MKKIVVLLLFLLSLSFVSAATLRGTIYNENLQPEKNVIVSLNTQPLQKVLAIQGTYSFEVPPGNYILTASKGNNTITEQVEVVADGEFVYDLFLFPGFDEEEQILEETTQDYALEEAFSITPWWIYVLLILIFTFLGWRIVNMRRKYGSLKRFRARLRQDQQKTPEQHQQDLAQNPGYLEEALQIIRTQDGRISQKDLRKEMLHLSEAKVSLIVTELEHKGKIEKIKKGRGNVLILK